MDLKKLMGVVSIASVAPMVEALTRFSRTVVLSRLLSPTEFGISAALTVTLGFGEMITDIAIDRFLITSSRDSDHDVLASVHKLAVIRGTLLAVFLFVAAPWIAQFVGAQDEVWSFRIVSLVCFLRSFIHLETKQVKREFRYGPEAWANTSSMLLGFAMMVPAALWFHDHRAVVLSLFVETLACVVVSHVVSRTRFSIVTRDNRVLREALAFGLPLTANGIALALMSQCDRLIVGHFLGLKNLAYYTVLLNLTVIPLSFISSILGTIGISALTRARHESEAQDRNVILIWVFAIIAAAYALFVAVTADTLSPFIFGHGYTIPVAVHILVTWIVWIRVNRGNAPTIMMLTRGETRTLMLTNLAAGVGLLMAAAALQYRPDISTMLACLVAGDLLAFAVVYGLLWPRLKSRATAILQTLLWSFAITACATAAIPVTASNDFAQKAVIFSVGLILIGAQMLYGYRRYIRANGARPESAVKLTP
jgi:O-antigen/teichoic acid export membrane protein